MSAAIMRRFMDILCEIKAYHGSGNNHAGFHTNHKGHNSHTLGSYDSTRHGIFFTTNPKFAALYGDVQEYDLNISRTIDLDENTHIIADFVDELRENYEKRVLYLEAKEVLRGHWPVWHLFENDLGEAFVRFLRSKGYDSATFEEWNDDDDGEEIHSHTIVVFNPSKVVKGGQYELDLWNESWSYETD